SARQSIVLPFVRVQHVAVNLESVAEYLVSSSHESHRLFHRRKRRRKRLEVEPVRISSVRDIKGPVARHCGRTVSEIGQSQRPARTELWKSRGNEDLSRKGGAIVIDAAETQAGDTNIGIKTDVRIIADVPCLRDHAIPRKKASAILIFSRGKNGYLAIQARDTAANPGLTQIRVAVGGISVTDLELGAFIYRTVVAYVIPHHKIDHTGDRVRAVNG